jgi:hypothetical protein
MALSVVDRSHLQARVLQYLNAAGRQTVAASGHDCIADGIMRDPFSTATSLGPPSVVSEAFGLMSGSVC